LRRDRTCSGNNGGTPFVLAVELLTVLSSLSLVLELGRHRRGTRPAHGRQFRGLRPYIDTAPASVIGNAVVVVVDDNRAVINVRDTGDVDPVYGAVVIEVISPPIAAVVAATRVAEAIVDATIEAYVRSPEAAMEAVATPIKTPVARGPERPIVRRRAPGARDPVVSGGSPAPVAGSPQIVRFRSLRLLIDRKRRGWCVGIFDRLAGIGIGIQLVVILSVLIRWVSLIRWRRRLLLGVFLRALLRGGLRT
jgi:hypothetical protein